MIESKKQNGIQSIIWRIYQIYSEKNFQIWFKNFPTYFFCSLNKKQKKRKYFQWMKMIHQEN